MPNGLVGLFGSELSDPRLGPAIICEGWADALHVERLGYPNCMAIQTSNLHENQWEFIKQFEYTIVMPDGDNGGNFFIDTIAPYIDEHEFLIARVPWGKDPADSTDEEIVEAIEEATKWAPSKQDVKLEFKLED